MVSEPETDFYKKTVYRQVLRTGSRFKELSKRNVLYRLPDYFLCRRIEILKTPRLTGELSKGLKIKNAAEIGGRLKDLSMPFLSLRTYFVCKNKKINRGFYLAEVVPDFSEW